VTGRVKSPSRLRAEQAAQTRARILDAAREVFERCGYAGARIEDIADQAGVATPTVYKGFLNKRTLLIGAVERAMTGVAYGAHVQEQDWWQEQLHEPEPTCQLQLIARNARRIYDRAAGVLEVLHAAAPLDADIATAWTDFDIQRRTRSHHSAIALLDKARGRARLDAEETAVTLLALTRPELYTEQRRLGRTPDQYETWLADLLIASLLHPTHTSR